MPCCAEVGRSKALASKKGLFSLSKERPGDPERERSTRRVAHGAGLSFKGLRGSRATTDPTADCLLSSSKIYWGILLTLLQINPIIQHVFMSRNHTLCVWTVRKRDFYQFQFLSSSPKGIRHNLSRKKTFLHLKVNFSTEVFLQFWGTSQNPSEGKAYRILNFLNLFLHKFW